MKLVFLIVILFCAHIQLGCSLNNSNLGKHNDDYKEIKSGLNRKLTNHFPKELHTYNHSIFYRNKSEDNNISLFLHEDGLGDKLINTIEKEAKKKSIALYNGLDSCNLVLNLEILNNCVLDSATQKKSITICDKENYPVPFFLKVKSALKSPTNLSSDYTIYVYEARSGIHFKEYKLAPLPCMPNNWKNGFSRGIVINRKEKTVIYWVIVW